MRRFSKLTALGMVLSLALSVDAAEIQKAKMGRLSGNVRTFNQDKTEVTVRRGTTDRIVIVGRDTKFNKQSDTSSKATPSSIEELRESNYLTCTGTWEGPKLTATSCTISSPKQR